MHRRFNVGETDIGAVRKCQKPPLDSHTNNHSTEEWVRGDVHTNGVESVWSLLKRSIVGAYHKVSVKDLDAYLEELEHRFNNRNNDFLFRDTLLKLVKSEKLTYETLVKSG